MTKDKQIEEMTDIIVKQNCKHCGCENCDYAYEYGTKEESCEDYVSYRRMAEEFYNAGYRKQSNGCDCCQEGAETCGTCVKFFDYYEDGGSDRCSAACDGFRCDDYKPVKFCSNCGAKMKGDEGK